MSKWEWKEHWEEQVMPVIEHLCRRYDLGVRGPITWTFNQESMLVRGSIWMDLGAAEFADTLKLRGQFVFQVHQPAVGEPHKDGGFTLVPGPRTLRLMGKVVWTAIGHSFTSVGEKFKDPLEEQITFWLSGLSQQAQLVITEVNRRLKDVSTET
jgi:hypothetical protein